MDEAAAAAPDDTRVQLVRAVTYEAFPAVLARGKIARQALDDLVARVEKIRTNSNHAIGSFFI
jgi:hypothetical protein